MAQSETLEKTEDATDEEDVEEEAGQTRRERAHDRSKKMADWLADSGGWFFETVWALLLIPSMMVLRRVPKSDKLADKFIERGFEMKMDLSGADSMVFTSYGDGQVIPRPATWQSADQAYKTSNGETYSAAGEGHRPYLLWGKIPVTFTLRAASEVFEPIQAYVARKRELGEWIADRDDDSGELDVYLDPRPPDDSDGMVLSWEKTWEMHYQKISQEDLQEQHDLGRLEELNNMLGNRTTWMVLGAFIGGMVTVLVILYVINRFFIGGGGGEGVLLTLSPMLGVI